MPNCTSVRVMRQATECESGIACYVIAINDRHDLLRSDGGELQDVSCDREMAESMWTYQVDQD